MKQRILGVMLLFIGIISLILLKDVTGFIFFGLLSWALLSEKKDIFKEEDAVHSEKAGSSMSRRKAS